MGYWMWPLYILFIVEEIVVFILSDNILNPDLSIIFSLSTWWGKYTCFL